MITNVASVMLVNCVIFLGVKIEQDRTTGMILIGQPLYTSIVLHQNIPVYRSLLLP